jgi:hypothetical protein
LIVASPPAAATPLCEAKKCRWPIRFPREQGVKAALALLCLIAAPLGVWAQSVSIERMNIANAGIYELKIKKTIGDPNLAGRSRYVVTGVRRIRNTTSIPARMCTNFGFEYIILGAPPNADVPIKMVTIFPSVGLRNLDTGQTTYRHETVVNRSIGKVHFRTFTLESAWELVPGVWTFELWYRDRKLGEQSFTLTAPCADCKQDAPPGGSCEERLVSAVPSPEDLV